MKKRMVKMESLFTSTCQFSKSHTHLDGKPRGTEEKGRRERKRETGWDEGMNSNEFILIL